MRLLHSILLVAFLSAQCTAQSKELRIVFQPDSPQFSNAAREYETIWAREGPKISVAMEAARA